MATSSLALFFMPGLRLSLYPNNKSINSVNVVPMSKISATPSTMPLLTMLNYFKKVGVCRNIKNPDSDRNTLEHIVKNINTEIAASPPDGLTIFKQENKTQRGMDCPQNISSNHLNIFHLAISKKLNPEPVSNTY